MHVGLGRTQTILTAIVSTTTYYEGNYVEKQINDRPVENQMNEHNHH